LADETVSLAEFAAGLGWDEIPASVKQRAKDSIADTIATMVFGCDLPWSRMIIDYARETGSGEKSHILGDGDAPVTAPFAALANGALAQGSYEKACQRSGVTDTNFFLFCFASCSYPHSW